MRNPWLEIPLDDYEAHMALPSVGQAQLLSEIFGRALRDDRPRSVAMIGCAGGNGFEQIPGTSVERAVGIDINPQYVERTRQRFAEQTPQLELFVGDVQSDELAFEPVELVFAGLLLEYVDVARTLDRIHSMLGLQGTLVTVLQLPSSLESVTRTRYETLSLLAPILRLVPPERIRELASERGFHLTEESTVSATGGKHFLVQTFVRQ